MNNRPNPVLRGLSLWGEALFRTKRGRRSLGGLALWGAGLILFAWIDRVRHTSHWFTVYVVLAAVVVVIAKREPRRPTYKFSLTESGSVRSALGFEVRPSNSCLEYIEGDHKITWQATSIKDGVATLKFSASTICEWDAPFSGEPIAEKKRQEIAKAVTSALVFRQLAEAGKVRGR